MAASVLEKKDVLILNAKVPSQGTCEWIIGAGHSQMFFKMFSCGICAIFKNTSFLQNNCGGCFKLHRMDLQPRKSCAAPLCVLS